MLTPEDIETHLAATTVALGVLDTRARIISAANTAFAELLGYPLDQTVGLRIDQYLRGDRLEAAIATVDAMRRGYIDTLEGQVEFQRADGTSAWAYSWSMPLGKAAPHDSILMGAAPSTEGRPEGFDASHIDRNQVILGALDHDWRFTDVALAAAAKLGWPEGDEERARLQDIVHPADVPAVLALLGRASVEKEVATIQARVHGIDRDWMAARITLSPLCEHPTPRFAIAIYLTPDVPGGSAPVGVAYVDRPDLTERQNEIVRRLVQGQRVPAIARDLFLSQSTVRNHLSVAYRKLGVRSQWELIEAFRSPR